MLIGWGSWNQRAARVAPRANAEVPPNPGRIISHPRIRNPSIFLQLQPPGDENGDLPGRYRPARYGNPNPTRWLLNGGGSWNQRAAGVAPRDNVELPPHPERIRSHPRIRNPSKSLQIQQTGGENADPPGRYRPAGCGKTPTQLAGCWHGATARRELPLGPTARSRRTRGG